MATRADRRARLATGLAFVIGAGVVLSGCQVGFDAGLLKQCAFTYDQSSPRSYVNQVDCPGDPATIIASGNYWQVASNSPGPNQSHCGGTTNTAYRVSDDGSTPLLLSWAKAAAPDAGYTVTQGITKNPCVSGAEITFAMFNGQAVPITKLTTDNDLQLIHRAGTHHVNIAAYMRDPVTGDSWTMAVVFRPTSTGDPRWNKPTAGVFFKGTNEHGTRLLLLDASYFGIPALCSGKSCPITHVSIDWDTLLQFVRAKGWWTNLWPVQARVIAQMALQVQTFNDGSRIIVAHHGWVMATKK